MNGVVIHIMMDGLVGSFSRYNVLLPPMTNHYNILDKRFSKGDPGALVVTFTELLVMAPLCLLAYRARVLDRPYRPVLEAVVSAVQCVALLWFHRCYAPFCCNCSTLCNLSGCVTTSALDGMWCCALRVCGGVPGSGHSEMIGFSCLIGLLYRVIGTCTVAAADSGARSLHTGCSAPSCSCSLRSGMTTLTCPWTAT